MSGPVPSAIFPVHELCAGASHCFPPEVQERFALLQANNTEGTRIEAEAADLQALVNAYNARTLDKANALRELQRRSTDTGDNLRS